MPAVLAATLVLGTATGARADLHTPLYVQGKAAYAADRWRDAINALVAYESADQVFLAQNPAIKAKVDAAIADARRRAPFQAGPGSVMAAGISVQGAVAAVGAEPAPSTKVDLPQPDGPPAGSGAPAPAGFGAPAPGTVVFGR
jgi:hypothetical protein